VKRKRWRNRLLLLTFSLLFALLVGELFLRWVIFHGGEGFKQLRDPGNYFHAWDEGYWKLHYRVDTHSKPPQNPHPYLGWTQKMNPTMYYHSEGYQLKKRRPVLLYGDSFSACIDSVQCFEDILNADSTFARDNFLLNYGTGGYGVCQASLLCRKTAPHFDKPLVVFGMLTSDIERTILPMRVGQKPYYTIENGALTLKGLPIDSSAAHFYEQHPLGTTSYLLRFFNHNLLGFDGRERSIAHIKAVNGLLIQHLVKELRALDIDFIFLIFHFEEDMMGPEDEDNWHDPFLKQTMADNQIPHIWSKDIIRAHRLAHPENRHGDYLIPGEGHPSSLYNRLIADEIKRVALRQPRPADFIPDSLNEQYYESRITRWERKIRANPASMERMALKAAQSGLSLDEQVHGDAVYLMGQELEREKPFPPDGVFEGKWRHE
jgi:hypothetical protein